MATPDKYNQPEDYLLFIDLLKEELLNDYVRYDDKIYYIYAGVHPEYSILFRENDSILEQIDEAYLAGKRNIFFECVGEGLLTLVTRKVHDVATIVKEKYPDVVCVLLTGASNGEEAYLRLCERFNLTPVLNILSCCYFELVMKNSWVTNVFNIDYPIGTRKKIYTCLNRVLRPHRVEFLNRMIAANLINDNCYYSFYDGSATNGGLDRLLHIFTQHYPNHVSYIIDNIEFVKTLRLNTDPNRTNPADLRLEDFNLFLDSYFSVIPETGYYNPATLVYTYEPLEDCAFFSEKTYKSILLKQPFILLARKGSLAELRRRGFKTFSPMINETYDTIEDDQLRMDAIVNEVARLANQTEDQWEQWVTKMRDIVEYNFNHLHSQTSYIMDKDLIGRLNII